MTGHYEPDHRETDAERSDREHDEMLARRDRLEDKGPIAEWRGVQLTEEHRHTNAEIAALGRLAESPSVLHLPEGAQPGWRVLPRDLDDHPEARARIEALATEYATVEVDRLPPLNALHWLVRCRRPGGVDVFRVGAHGSLMPWEDVRP